MIRLQRVKLHTARLKVASSAQEVLPTERLVKWVKAHTIDLAFMQNQVLHDAFHQGMIAIREKQRTVLLGAKLQHRHVGQT